MRSLDNKTPKVTVPERIWAAPPYDDPGWETGAGEWDVSENWAAEGKECFIHIDLHQAEVAAAYERAAEVAYSRNWSITGDMIRALATTDQTAALDRLITQAEARVWEHVQTTIRKTYDDGMVSWAQYQRMKSAILAASKKGGA